MYQARFGEVPATALEPIRAAHGVARRWALHREAVRVGWLAEFARLPEGPAGAL
jgi:hypothetical protein